MKNYIISIICIAIPFFSTCSKSKNSETEPNNTFINANPIELNREYWGYLDSENDIDYYVLNNTQDQILKIELSGIKGINHAINIYINDNSKSHLIKTIDDNRKSAPEIFSNLYVQPGQYYFCITHGDRDIKKGNNETPYKFIITSRALLDEEKEPNDTPHTATDITGKKSIRGFYSPSRNSMNTEQKNKMHETDWYKFNIETITGKPSLVDINISGVYGVDTVLSVYNSNLEEITTTDNTGTGEGESIPDLGIKESGTYYILVCSKNFQFNHDNPYELKINIKEFDPLSELEPNNSFDKINTIPYNKINGRINYSSDVDYYQHIPADKNRYYKIKCSAGNGIDPVINIYDFNRNKILSINNAGPGQMETIPCLLIRQSIIISISSISLSSDESNYTLEIEESEIHTAIENEPNNSKTNANLFDKNISGFINYKNDTDYYVIKTDERKKIKFTVKGVKSGKIKVSITDPLGFIIKSKEIESDNEITFTDTVDKKGYIIVEPVNANFEYPYTISIED
jgi:hypothetical protein